MLPQITNMQIRYAKLFCVLFFLCTALAAVITSDLAIDPSFSALVSPDSEYNTNERIITGAFGVNDGLLILIKEDENTIAKNTVRVTDPEVMEYIETLKETLTQSQYVKDIIGPEFDRQGRIAQLFISVEIPKNTDGFKQVLNELNSYVQEVGEPVGISATVTGLPVLLNRVTTLLINDNLITILFTLLFVLLIAYWYARDWLYALIIIAVPLTSLIFLAASMVLLHIEVTLTLAAIGVLVLGLGADYSIHIATHYRRARREFGTHAQALHHTISDLRLPITASFITTLAGFCALIFGVSPSSQAQGIVLSLAILIIFFTTFLIFPILITLAQTHISLKENPAFARIRKGLAKIAVFQARHAGIVIGLVAAVTVIMFFGIMQVEFSTSNSNWIPDDDPIAKSFREITYTFGDEERLSLLIQSTQGDLRSVETAQDLNRLTSLIANIPYIESISSPYENISYNAAELQYTLTQERSAQFNKDFTLTRMQLTTKNAQQNEAGDSLLLQEVRTLINTYPIYHAEIKLYGDLVRFEELGDSLEKDAGKTTAIGLALVFLMASLIYGSLRVGMLALLPIIIAILWALGLMGFFKVPFTSLSTGIISLVLGIGVDFSIHLVDGITKFSRKHDIESAIRQTLEGTGSAIVLAAITTFVGFLALTFANLLGTQRLGWSLAFSILSVFIVTMSLVPAVMSLGRRYKSEPRLPQNRRNRTT